MKTSPHYKQVVADHCHMNMDEIGLQLLMHSQSVTVTETGNITAE